MASKFYYSLSNTFSKSVGENAAKTASDSSQYATPKDTFTIHNYYVDADTNANTKANYEYIAPTTNNNYGGWASHNYYAIAQDRFYYKNSSSSAYTSFKFVNRLSAPLLKKQTRAETWDHFQAPFSYSMVMAEFSGDRVKIYWDNSNNRIQIDVLRPDGTKESDHGSRQGYGVFILLSGAGGGGGGGDLDHWGQGHPGGGGGGGGGTALMYFDAKKAYDAYPGSYLLISIGLWGEGGKGGAGFTAGSTGGHSIAQFKSSSGELLYAITCGGGKGGAGHAWDAAADAAGGTGGGVWTTRNDDTYNDTCSTILKLLDSATGGNGGAGKRGSDGSSGSSISSGNWNIPFKDSWGKLDIFKYNGATCYMGKGGPHNWQGGGGGGCGTEYISSTYPNGYGHGMGGYGGGRDQAGANGENGICHIFYNYIPGVTDGCDAKKV